MKIQSNYTSYNFKATKVRIASYTVYLLELFSSLQELYVHELAISILNYVVLTFWQ